MLRRIYGSNLYLPHRIKLMLANSLLLSQVLYGLEVYSGTIGVNIDKLKRIVNTIIRFVYNLRRDDHTSAYVIRFLGCSFEMYINYRCILIFYNLIKNGIPCAFRRLFQFSHSTRNPQIYIPRIWKNIYSSFFCH